MSNPVQSFSYVVPGMKVVLAQAGPMTCWATVYTMMASWKRQMSFDIRQAVGAVDPRYAQLYDDGLRAVNPQGMPSADFRTFLQRAGLTWQPMANWTIPAWHEKLRNHGLLWIGTWNTLGAGRGLHSRIIEGMYGSGDANNTSFKIIDPDGGRRYDESFAVFLQKYEGAFRSISGEYLQVRHY